jgi:hypothetical protein
MSGTPTDFLYYNARSMFATAQINWPAANVRAMLVSNQYAPLLTDKHVSDIPPSAVIVRDLVCTAVGQNNGVCFCTIPPLQSFSSPYLAVALVLYVSTGTDSTSSLVYYSSTGVGFPLALTGFTYFVAFDQANGGFFQV